MTELGPVAQRILTENESARVWSIDLAPGERLQIHHHQNPYVVVSLSESVYRVTNSDGTTLERSVSVGTTDWHAKGETHALEILGDKPYSNILVEFK
jgi:quercetin dioxygenase-like cupin family protein